MRVLIVGGGAREHCIARKLKEDGAELYTSMNNLNPGLARLSTEVLRVSDTEISSIVEWSKNKDIKMAVIGPEAPLGKGIVDELVKVGIPSVGPSKTCARLETSKSFTRNLLEKYNIPGNPEFRVFTSPDGIREFLEQLGEYVIKDEGLAGGKGVKLSGEHLATVDEGVEFATSCIKKSGAVVVEEKFVGEEFSLQCITDGITVIGTPLAQDHKRAFEGDTGPNTGGMGSYSDSNQLLPFLTQADYDAAMDITRKVCKALHDECGQLYRGIMYGGFIATRKGVRLVEYNARFGDPEVMNVIPLLESSLLDIFKAVIEGNLEPGMARFSNKATVCKYVVPKGYGVKSEAGHPLHVNEKAIEEAGARLYYAAVDQRDGGLYTGTSRALGVVGIGDTISEAEQKAERALAHVKGHVFMRHDIGTAEAIEKKIERMKRIRA
ncbi:MAG: phosphoribosylamine--glycine ligase [Candidatus Thermoplasmatota archaeon]|nr:phosphoribosylamine--glycine ligase [Candidatus Thermoplasmatota archaeon]MBU4071711.1 phosphoribosylamine--glycine ligase [Candidatus Thermoplasmatota archaeon]MBU4143790.1 phosphoribosylamine--glycine ligase [Candidatus Thermoplasmatota archaeon]MBU4591376.1 phosphoribosylamine--glycine ligase [Candidatus Thermoplasmatota archaeon]